MKTQVSVACCAVLLFQGLASGFFWQETRQKVVKKPVAKPAEAQEEAAPAFSFADEKYFERFANVSHDLIEYTPADQTDLDRFTDMVTLNYYHKTTDAEGLATVASSVLKNYRANMGTVVGAKSVPRTKDRPAEHLIVVIFTRPEFAEVSFSRFRLHDGIGTSVVYSRRVYGKGSREEIDTWVKKHGPAMDKRLMEWNEMPKTPAAE